MPLPGGWSATLTDYAIDSTHVPPLWCGTVRFSDTKGRSFSVTGSIPITEVPKSPDPVVVAQTVVAGVWSTYADYVLSTIRSLEATPVPPADPLPAIPVVIP